MIGSAENSRRQWGKSEITGGRHFFRLGLMLAEIEKWAGAGARVLDAGCGDGSLTLALLERGFAAAAVDASGPGMERLAKKLEGSDANVFLAQGSLDRLPFPDASFELVVSGEVLEHLADDGAAVREFYRVLKPEGVVVVSVPANPALWGIEDEWAGHARRYEAAGLRVLFEEAGLATVDLHHWGWPVTYLYNRILFKRWLSRRLAQSDPDLKAGSAVGMNPLVARAMALCFSIDRLFLRSPWGIGLIGVFRKSSAE